MADVIAPDSRLPLEAQLTVAQEVSIVGLLDVDIGGQPEPRAHVFAPAVEVEEDIGSGRRRVRSVKTDNVVVLVFHPDAADKASGKLWFCLDVEDKATHVAQEFTADVSEIIVPAIEALIVNK